MMDSIYNQNRRASIKNLKVHFEEPPVNEVYSVTHPEYADSESSCSLDDHKGHDHGTYNLTLESNRDGGIDQLQTSISTDSSSPSPAWSSSQSGSITQSPPLIQATEYRIPGYDPNRIPMSVFTSKPAAANMEWSVASNESLFSIQVGNGSFSRDHFSAIYKSGELTKSSNEMMSILSTLPPVMEAPIPDHSQGSDMENNSGLKENSNEEAEAVIEEQPDLKDIPVDYTPKDNKINESKSPAEEVKHNLTSPSYLFDGSNRSTQSFQFPVDTGRSSPDTAGSEKQWQYQTSQHTPQKKLDIPKPTRNSCFPFNIPCFCC